MRIAIGSDHRGFKLKEYLREKIKMNDQNKIEWIDCGAFNDTRSDYPEFAVPVCNEVEDENADCGILICGTGVGMSIAANKFLTIYAALAWSEEVAKASREDDNSNILVLPSDFVSNELAEKIIFAWINAKFKGGDYQKRIDMINEISGTVIAEILDEIDEMSSSKNNNNDTCC